MSEILKWGDEELKISTVAGNQKIIHHEGRKGGDTLLPGKALLSLRGLGKGQFKVIQIPGTLRYSIDMKTNPGGLFLNQENLVDVNRGTIAPPNLPALIHYVETNWGWIVSSELNNLLKITQAKIATREKDELAS